jgi:hypothetical protein
MLELSTFPQTEKKHDVTLYLTCYNVCHALNARFLTDGLEEIKSITWPSIIAHLTSLEGYKVAQFVGALCYKLECHGFDY